MMRSVVIFSFFALATVLVILLQPGPRSEFTYETDANALQETSRNHGGVLDTAKPMPALQAPDNVISDLKAASQIERSAPIGEPQGNQNPTAGSLSKLQAALDASLGKEPVISDAEPAPIARSEPVVEPAQPLQRSTHSSVAPELRDMSWQTLKSLNSLGQVAKAPGQEGSLLNSIVRRSMGQVGSAPKQAPVRTAKPTPAPRKAVIQPRATVATPVRKTVTAAPAPRKADVRQAAVQRDYVVASGDTLALIAIKLYGTALAIDDLLAQNPSLRQNPNSLRIGQVLRYSN